MEARAKRIVSDLGICEFILSNELVSMALAMCAENPAVIAILSVGISYSKAACMSLLHILG